MIPFFQKRGKNFLVKLHKDLYTKEIIERAQQKEPGSVVTIGVKSDYYLVELALSAEDDCFAFLNYLIYLRRSE